MSGSVNINMDLGTSASEKTKLDIPENFFRDYQECVEALKGTMDEIKTMRQMGTLKSTTERFIRFYETFASEKEVFDSLNLTKHDDDPIYAHSINVALLARMLGEINHLHSDDLYVLTQSALLFDIGKTAIDPELLNKKGKPTPHEFNIIKKHAKYGYQMLYRLMDDPRIASVALMHHERCDGSGYPMGMRDVNINEFSRIVAICDVYSGMISSRGYKDSKCPFEIIRMFEKAGLYRFDSDYTLLFLRSMLDTYVGYKVRLTTGEEATIVDINPMNLSNPYVSINGMKVNLSQDEKRNIISIL